MGKAVPKGIKSKVELLLNKFTDKFSTDFGTNKLVMRELKVPLSKKNINLLSGFMVRQVKALKEEKAELERKDTKPTETDEKETTEAA